MNTPDKPHEARKITLVAPDNYYSVQFTLEGGNQCIIGRSDSKTAFYPMIDLTDLGAYLMGVSRMHATLEWRDNELYITDHSSNGTSVNGVAMQKGETRALANHSMIMLGELCFHIVIQP